MTKDNLKRIAMNENLVIVPMSSWKKSQLNVNQVFCPFQTKYLIIRRKMLLENVN